MGFDELYEKTKKVSEQRWTLTIYYSQRKQRVYWQDVKPYMDRGKFMGVGADSKGSYITFEFPSEKTAMDAKKKLQDSEIAGVQEIEVNSYTV